MSVRTLQLIYFILKKIDSNEPDEKCQASSMESIFYHHVLTFVLFILIFFGFNPFPNEPNNVPL